MCEGLSRAKRDRTGSDLAAKIDPVGPILAAKSDPPLPKVIPVEFTIPYSVIMGVWGPILPLQFISVGSNKYILAW